MSEHPSGTRARLLLTSVFKPFAQDDEFGSRAINPAELYHNQVTRARVRQRARAEAARLASGYGAALWAMEKYLRASNAAMSERIRNLRPRIERDIGGLSPLIDRTLGPLLLWSARREARLGPAGRTLEPRTFADRRNWSSP